MRNKINWSEIVDLVKREIVPQFQRQGVKPTLRTVFYALVSREAIPNTLSSYQQLSRALVKARKNGELPWDFIEDRTRYTVGHLDDRYTDESALEETRWRCEQRLSELDIERLIDEYFEGCAASGYCGYWAGQPLVVEVWVEKGAAAATIKRWLAGWRTEPSIYIYASARATSHGLSIITIL